MTATETLPTTTPTDDWDTQFAVLKTRFPKVRDTILFAFHVLQSNPDIELDDLKALAKQHGIRVIASTVNAARRLLDRNPATDRAVTGSPTKPAAADPRSTRQRRASKAPLDVEDLIRNTVAKVQAQGEVETERLRAAIRKAVAVLEAAVA